MPIKRRGNSWQAAAYYKGQRIRRTFKNYEDARRFEVEALASLMSGADKYSTSQTPERYTPTFKGLARRVWDLEWSSQKSADHTLKRIKSVCRYFDGTLVTDVSSHSLESYVFHLRSEGNGPATINRKLSIVSKIINYAHRHGIISAKPTSPFQKEPPGRLRYYSRQEERDILSALKEQVADTAVLDLALHDFFVVLVDTGLRKGEALGLEWADIGEDQITLSDPEKIKTERPRAVPMTKRVREVLKWRGVVSPIRPFDFTADVMDHLLRDFKRESGYTGKVDAFFHTCRHTFCSRLLQGGVAITTVKELAGHRDIKTTLRYAHLAPSNFKDAINMLEQ
mgnify:CR=1 FL=1